jgi:S1-C subfamily serine protease
MQRLKTVRRLALFLGISGLVPVNGQTPTFERGVVYFPLPGGGCGAGIVAAVRPGDILILTAYHNLKRSDGTVSRQLSGQFSRTDPAPFTAELLNNWVDSTLDLALLRVNRQGVPASAQAVRFGDSSAVKQGSAVSAVGHRLDRSALWIIDQGLVPSPVGTDVTFAGRLVDRGFSGGPVMTADGAVVGMVYEATAEHIGYARTIDTIRGFLRGLGLDSILQPPQAASANPLVATNPSSVAPGAQQSAPMTVSEVEGTWAVKPGFNNGQTITFTQSGGKLTGTLRELDPCRNLTLSFPLEQLALTPEGLSFSYVFREAANAWACPGESFRRPNQDVVNRYSYRGRIQRSEPYKGALMLNPNDSSILVLYKTGTLASGANRLFNFRTQRESGSTYNVSIDYVYAPKARDHSGAIRIQPINSDGSGPGYTYSRNPNNFSAGAGTVAYTITPDGGFTAFEFCLFESDPQAFAPSDPVLCERFPLPNK